MLWSYHLDLLQMTFYLKRKSIFRAKEKLILSKIKNLEKMTNLEFFKIVINEIFAMSHRGGETSVGWLINCYESLEILLCFRKSLTKDDFRETLWEKIVRFFWRKIMVRITEDLIRKRAEHNELMVRNWSPSRPVRVYLNFWRRKFRICETKFLEATQF